MMPKINRLTGRFFTVLISLSVAVFLPRAVMAGEATPRPPLASPAGVGVLPGLRANLPAAPLAGGSKQAPSPTLCQISDTVYRADGTPAQGTVLLSWQAFTTTAGQAVTPGSLLVTLDSSGGFNASLAPNTGASPAGTYYKAIFKLDDGTTETEFWVVPNTQTTTIGAIRSKLVPANQAAQFLTRDFADSNYVNLASTQSISGVKTFSVSPGVPTPQKSTDAANKAYVDTNSGAGILGSPPPIGNVSPNSGAFSILNATDASFSLYPIVDVRAYRAVGDGKLIAGGATAAGSTLVTAPSGSFAAGDVGKTIVISEAGTATGCIAGHANAMCPFKSTIASFVDSSHVNMAAPATSTTGSELILFGTDNRAAIQAAIDLPNYPMTSEYDIYIPHALGNGTAGPPYAAFPGCYLIDGTIEFPNSTHDQFKWIRMRGDGNEASTLCEAQWNADLIHVQAANVGGTELWFKDFGVYGTPGYFDRAGIHCQRCMETRIEGIWFSNWQKAIWYDVDSSGNGSQILRASGNTFELTYNAVKWEPYTGTFSNWMDFHDNLIDIGSFNDALDSSGNPFYPFAIEINKVSSAEIFDNYFWGLGRGIKAVDSTDLNIHDNDLTFLGNALGGTGSVYRYGYQNISLSGTGAHLTQRASIHDNHFGSTNGEAIDIVGDANASFHGNSYAYQAGTPQSYMIVAAFNGANTLGISGELVTSCASPCITVASGALGAGSIISGNSFASSIATPISITGSLPSGAYAALNSGDIAGGSGAFAGDLTARDIPGAEYFVSHYASIQAAINAAYNNGSVLGTVIDDRTAPYTGPGFILYDSVTLKLAATTYTINGTVTYNNGNNNVTAGIIAVPGAKLIGASTSTNHGTIITAGNGLNADLIATSTVGTGIAAAAQWWHWGGFENLRVMGNGAHQTAGNCFNIENMGETAFVRSIEVSGCYLDNILFTGASATPSDIANITTNSAGRYGFNFNNLAGVAVVHGLSGDSNATSIIRLNGGQSGTLTILGLKTEEEISGQDPLITIDQSGQNGAQPSLFIVGGYTFGRNGVNDVIKYVNGTLGTTPYISVSNFYVQNYVNAVNDVVNSRTTAATNMNKVPFYFGPTGAFFSGQAFTLDLNTFVQSPHSGNYVLTEVFGTTSSNETIVAASGTSTTLSTGGIGFRMPNRTTYGQTPELFAKMTYAFPGGVPNTQQWEFIPAKVNGDASTRWIGDPSYRWDEIYSADVNSTTATVGTLNVTTCNGCSSQQVNSDWNAGSGVAQILNKPALATVATSGSYNDLSNKPAIPSSSSWPNAASCPANQYETADANGSGPTCAQVQYSQLSGTPTTSHLIAGSMQGSSATLTGNSADQTIYTATLPAGTFAAGTGARCKVQWQHTTSGSTAITYKWTLGSASVAYASFTSASTNLVSDVEVLTPSSLSAQIINASAVIGGTTIQVGPNTATGSENLANSDTIKFTFNAGTGEQVKGISFYCQTVQ